MPAFDVSCPILSLPGLFKTTLQNIPTQTPLVAEEGAVEKWRGRVQRSGPAVNVGIAWAGSPSHRNDRNRSMALADFAPLATIPGACFYSLQKGEAAKQAAEPPGGMRLIDWADELLDFADTAALVANLDLVISVDTSVVHLAAAMGKPVWVLLPFLPDWRWMMNGEESPWYPRVRLFRQSKPGDWSKPMADVIEELRKLKK